MRLVGLDGNGDEEADIVFPENIRTLYLQSLMKFEVRRNLSRESMIA